MNDETVRSTYRSPLRTRQKAQTSELIMEAVKSILDHGELGDVTIAAVARIAQVTDRTVYRHYTARDDMILAFLRWHLERAGGATIQTPKALDTYMVTVKRVFANWAVDEGVIRALYLAPEGRQARKSATRERILRLREIADAELPELSESEREGLAVAMGSLALAENYIMMRDVLDLKAGAMGEAMTAAVDFMIDGARRKADALRNT